MKHCTYSSTHIYDDGSNVVILLLYKRDGVDTYKAFEVDDLRKVGVRPSLSLILVRIDDLYASTDF